MRFFEWDQTVQTCSLTSPRFYVSFSDTHANRVFGKYTPRGSFHFDSLGKPPAALPSCLSQ